MPSIIAQTFSKLMRVPRRRPKPCLDAGAFIRRHGEILPVELPAGQTPRFPLPEPLFGELAEPNDFMRQVGTYADRRLARLKNITIWSNQGFLMADGEVLAETCWGPENLVGHPVSVCGWQPPLRRLKGAWFSCSLYWSTYYYHWMCDVLPRLQGVVENIPTSVRFLIHSPLKEYEQVTLAALGIGPERCRVYDGIRPLKPTALYYATPVAMSGDHEPESIRWVRRKVLDHVFPQGAPAADPNLRLYISRSQTKMRRVVNEEALLPILQRHGFTIVHAETLSFTRQVALFARASVIAGPHGGGMTNILWAPESCSIFEVFEPATVRRYYWSLAHALGQRYFMSVGEARENPGTEADIVIDPEKFEQALREVLKS